MIHALGLPDDLLRTIAIVGLILFGLALAIPLVGDRIEAWLQRIAPAVRCTGREINLQPNTAALQAQVLRTLLLRRSMSMVRSSASMRIRSALGQGRTNDPLPGEADVHAVPSESLPCQAVVGNNDD